MAEGSDDNASYSVLQAHHDRNKPCKAPLFAPMESDDDVDVTDLEVEDVEFDADSTVSDDESKDELEGHTRAKRHSLMPHGSSVSPTQL